VYKYHHLGTQSIIHLKKNPEVSNQQSKQHRECLLFSFPEMKFLVVLFVALFAFVAIAEAGRTQVAVSIASCSWILESWFSFRANAWNSGPSSGVACEFIHRLTERCMFILIPQV
jgi:hypothetical protein